jgi:hypothetical protein
VHVAPPVTDREDLPIPITVQLLSLSLVDDLHVGRADLVILRCGLCAWARGLCSLYAPGLGGSLNFRQIMG